jgi:hypothetical protein
MVRLAAARTWSGSNQSGDEARRHYEGERSIDRERHANISRHLQSSTQIEQVIAHRRSRQWIDWNGEKRRDTGMGARDLEGWFAELAALDNPIRREFHLYLTAGDQTQPRQFWTAHCAYPESQKAAPSGPSISRCHAKWSCAWFEPCVSGGRSTVAGCAMDIPCRQRIGAPRRAKGGSRHAVEVG